MSISDGKSHKFSNKIDCEHFGSCSGCIYSSCEHSPELFLQAQEFFQQLGIRLHLVQGNPIRWRMRAKLAVRKRQIGLFQKNSHEILAIPHCQVHSSRINEAVARLKKALIESSLSSYDEVSGKGDLRYIQCVVERRSQKVQMSLVLNCKSQNSDTIAIWQDFLAKLYEEDKEEFWHSLWLNFQPLKTNAIFGPDWLHLFGQACIWEEIGGNEIAFGPAHFGQANLDVFDLLLAELQEKLPSNSRVIELYAGVGAIGLSVAKKASSVLFVEREKSSEHYFLLAKEKLSPHIQKKLSFFIASSAEQLNLLEGADVCIVDPPRKGLETRVREAIIDSQSLTKLFYISCHFDSFRKDCEAILASDKWRLIDATSYLFFPGTNHIEIFAIFEKKSG